MAACVTIRPVFDPARTALKVTRMQVICLDLEGVLVPEIWIAFSQRTGIPEFARTTRDEPDYDKLMKYRLALLKTHKLGLPDIQKVISDMGPMAGAKDFLDALRRDRRLDMLPRREGTTRFAIDEDFQPRFAM